MTTSCGRLGLRMPSSVDEIGHLGVFFLPETYKRVIDA
jgi:hypothetical protein